MPTSTRPRIRPAPMVPIPAIKNGIETCNVVFHHSSCLIGWWAALDGLRSNPLPSKPSPPFGSSDDAMDDVVIELNEPCDEGGRAENFSFSLSARWKKGKIIILLFHNDRNEWWCMMLMVICNTNIFIPCNDFNDIRHTLSVSSTCYHKQFF